MYIPDRPSGPGDDSTPDIARSIVRESLRAKPDEAIIIQAGRNNLDLAAKVALECYKVGADPAVLVENDEVFYGQFKYLTEDQLRKTSAHCLGIADYVQSYIWIGGVEDPRPMARVPRTKWAAMFEGEDAHYRKNLEKHQKQVNVALGMVTKSRAKAYGFNYAAWKRMTEEAIGVNYRKMRATGEALAAVLNRPAVVNLTADNGTNLHFRLAGEPRRAHVDDGVISDEDIALDNTSTSLPAGAVSVAPVETSANGTFVSDVKIPQVGILIEDLAWTFKNGRVVDFTAKRNLGKAQIAYKEASGARDMFGFLGVGINEKVKPGFLNSSYARGTVSVGIGDNQFLDGGNKSSYGFFGFLSQPTLEVDGRTVVEGGRLVL